MHFQKHFSFSLFFSQFSVWFNRHSFFFSECNNIIDFPLFFLSLECDNNIEQIIEKCIKHRYSHKCESKRIRTWSPFCLHTKIAQMNIQYRIAWHGNATRSPNGINGILFKKKKKKEPKANGTEIYTEKMFIYIIIYAVCTHSNKLSFVCRTTIA